MDFSSVRVIINLQTWVLLFDYLGIGVPTPPPSRSDTPTCPEAQPEEPVQVSAAPKGSGAQHHQSRSAVTQPQAPGREGVNTGLSGATQPRPPRREGVNTGLSMVDASLLEDAMDFCSLGSDENSLYVSAFQQPSTAPGDHHGNKGGETLGMLFEDSAIFESLQFDQKEEEGEGEGEKGVRATVWGAEGKLSLNIAVQVKSLSVTFNKPEHALAKGSVRSLSALLALNDGNTDISGSLGQASVLDLTQTGAYYRERCVRV